MFDCKIWPALIDKFWSKLNKFCRANLFRKCTENVLKYMCVREMSGMYPVNVRNSSRNRNTSENPGQRRIPDKMSVRKVFRNAHVLEHFPDTHFVRNMSVIIP